MKKIKIETVLHTCRMCELEASEVKLIEAAKEAAEGSYAPYSHFSVGAAVMLDNGSIVKGSNQENAAYPSGMCAERTAMFYANSQYPDSAVIALAVAAKDSKGFTLVPITPCGSCRQVMMETENRFNREITFYLYGEDCIYKIEGTKTLLPLSFGNEFLK